MFNAMPLILSFYIYVYNSRKNEHIIINIIIIVVILYHIGDIDVVRSIVFCISCVAMWH